MRNMSFSMTTPQFLDGSKDITRRFGWWNAKPGQIVMGVEKGMGLKKGEKINKLGPIEIISVRPETLQAMLDDLKYGMEELRREGYPFGCRSPACFVSTLLKGTSKKITDPVNRIEFKRLK